MLHVGWSHRTEAPARIMVYPDGCRDVIIAEPRTGRHTSCFRIGISSRGRSM